MPRKPGAKAPGLIALERLGKSVTRRSLKRLDDALRDDEQAKDFSPEQLLRLATLAARVAGLGKAPPPEPAAKEPDSLDAFRRATQPPQRVAHHTAVHNIEGVRRPIRDEGRADRKRFNARARQEGSPTLPA